MILSFADAATAAVFHDRPGSETRRLPSEILRAAKQKLDMLHAAHEVKDLRSPPGNRLEALRADLAGFYGIRINQRWRIVFRWEGGDAHEVRILDYHRG